MIRFSSQQREQIRLCILRHLDAAAGQMFGISTALLLQFIRNEGFPQLDESALKAELDYLGGKGLILSQPKKLSPENEHWKITSDGRDLYAQQQNG